MQELLEHMSRRVMRHTDGLRLETPLPNVSLGVLRARKISMLTLCEPMVCMVLQGAKEVVIGNRVVRYDTARCFTSLVELPATGCELEASEEKPYVAVTLALDRAMLAGLLADHGSRISSAPATAFGVAPVSRQLIEAWDHLLSLLDAPGDIPVLSAAREREVLYRLLQSEHGPMLRQVASEDSRLSQVRNAIRWIRQHYDQTLRTEVLADKAAMSVPSFHRHFKAATAMSPLQYQKTLRLHAARRMLLANDSTAHAAFSVGYESASQFSREYSRLFGVAPSQDAVRQKGLLMAVPRIMV